MGFKDANWAYTEIELPMAQKVVLVAICHATDDTTHTTTVAQQTLADRLGCSVETVRRAVGVLARLGVISRRERHDRSGYRTSDEITVNTAYQAESPAGAEPTGQTAHQADSGRLPDSQSPPTGLSVGAEVINQEINQGIKKNTPKPPRAPLAELVPADPRRTFEGFWHVWPRKDGKKAAERAWWKAATRADVEAIYTAAAAYAASPHRPPRQFIPHAATWLNGERWNDPLPQPPEADNRKPAPVQRAADIVALGEALAQKGIAS